MATWIYSVEGFPGSRESGRHTEYCEVLGHQINLPAGEWIKLKSHYDRPYWTDFRHRAAGTTNQAVAWAKKDIVQEEDVARALIEKYSGFGVVAMEDDPVTHPDKARRVVEAAKEQNRKCREHAVASYEEERKMRQLTGRGRLAPTAYERYCYQSLGLPEPGTLDAIKAERGTTEVKVELPPEVAELVAEGLAARRAKVELKK